MTADLATLAVSVAALVLSTATLVRTYRRPRIRLDGRGLHRAIQDYKRRTGIAPFEGDGE